METREKVVSWLVAISIVSFVTGMIILVVGFTQSDDSPPTSDHVPNTWPEFREKVRSGSSVVTYVLGSSEKPLAVVEIWPIPDSPDRNGVFLFDTRVDGHYQEGFPGAFIGKYPDSPNCSAAGVRVPDGYGSLSSSTAFTQFDADKYLCIVLPDRDGDYHYLEIPPTRFTSG